MLLFLFQIDPVADVFSVTLGYYDSAKWNSAIWDSAKWDWTLQRRPECGFLATEKFPHFYVYVRQMAAQNNANHFGDVFKTNHNRKRLPTLTK